MAKKRFTDDLFDLFEDSTPESTGPTAGEAEEAVDVQVPVTSSRARRKLSSKGFTQDLDAFLSDSFEQKEKVTPRSAPTSRRRRTGLDFLIRSTVREDDEDRAPRDRATEETKRVTLIFNKQHLQELKAQAKERQMYLKDVVQEMVSEYLKG